MFNQQKNINFAIIRTFLDKISLCKLNKVIASTTDIHVECFKIQNDIEEHLGLEEGTSLSFDYIPQDNKLCLNLITVNLRHDQSFLFHSVIGYDKQDALKKMLEYVKSYKEKENPYTIQWLVKGDDELHTSYFRAKDVYDALDKLYFGRDINTITVFSVVLNPIT